MQYSDYETAKQKAEEEAYKVKGEKRAKKPRKIPEPKIENAFLVFYANLMLVRALLCKYGYSYHWDTWNFKDLIETAFSLMVKGYTI